MRTRCSRAGLGPAALEDRDRLLRSRLPDGLRKTRPVLPALELITGFAINWNIVTTGGDTAPPLTTVLGAATAGYDPSHFTIMDNTDGTKLYKASPFGDTWEYAIEYNQQGGNAGNDTKLVFDVTKTGGLLLTDFQALNGFLFAVDIWQSPGGPTFVVAAKVPEVQTWLMFFAGLVGLTALVLTQRRRKFARAV